MNKLNDEKITTDLGEATALKVLGHDCTFDNSIPYKTKFIFKKTQKLEQDAEAYWHNSLRVSPLEFFTQLKIMKSMIYGNQQ